MSSALFQIAPLEKRHDRTRFHSGSEPLDRYFRDHVMQDIRRRITACFLALTGEQWIAGFYTLASASVLLSDLPASLSRKLPRYPSVPAIRLGRLAVDRNFKGRGLGGALLAEALERALRAEIAAYALVVDAKDESAAAFYQHHGFIRLSGQALKLFLPLATARGVAQRI